MDGRNNVGSASGHLSLDDLPSELLHRILELLAPRDVASSRLACSLLAKVGAEHLTEGIHLSYHPDSFENAKAMSAHPVSKAITRLFFQGGRIKEYSTLEGWLDSNEITIDKQRPFPHYMAHVFDATRASVSGRPGTPTTPLDLTGPSYAAAKQLFEDQRQLADSGADVEHLVRIFRECPHLDSVELFIGMDHRAWRSKLNRELMKRGVEPLGDIEPYVAGVHHIHSICSAAKTSARSLRYITAYNVGFQLLQQEPTMTLMKETLSNLHSFRLGFSPDVDFDSLERMGWVRFEDDLD